VVFASGWGDSSTTWADLQDALAATGRRSCAYDRAGYAWSSPGPGDPGLTAQADDLAALLARAGEPGPFVLVGHSWGGHVARLFHARWPGRVAGMVLLDVADEHSTDDLATLAGIQARAWSAAAAVGLLRTGAWMVDPRETRLTRGHVPVVFGPSTWAAAAAEMRAYDTSTRLVRALPVRGARCPWPSSAPVVTSRPSPTTGRSRPCRPGDAMPSHPRTTITCIWPSRRWSCATSARSAGREARHEGQAGPA
jgi:pimeloyl-ACP methyl ester carboxylesterase